MSDPDILRRIFLVEDDPHIQVIVEMSLEEFGDYTVSVFESGAALFAELDDRLPQLILLDVMLPEMDGPTILRHLKADPRTAGIPVIFMTAKVRPTDHAHYEDLGVLGVIGKPFDPVEMVRTVEDLWTRFRTAG